jgi:hypothetical protein
VCTCRQAESAAAPMRFGLMGGSSRGCGDARAHRKPLRCAAFQAQPARAVCDAPEWEVNNAARSEHHLIVLRNTSRDKAMEGMRPLRSDLPGCSGRTGWLAGSFRL